MGGNIFRNREVAIIFDYVGDNGQVRCFLSRKENIKCRSMVGFAADRDLGIAALQNTVHDPQSQAGAFAILCCEKRLENMAGGCFIHSDSRIRNTQPNPSIAALAF